MNAPESSKTGESGGKRNVVAGVIKALGLLIGGVGSVLCLASLVGAGSDNLWVGLGVGTTVALVLPALIVGKLLPDDVSKRQKGLFGDVYALCWLGFLLLYAVAANALTRDLLAEQADRLSADGHDLVGSVVYALAAVEPLAPPPPAIADSTPSVPGSTTSSASAAVSHSVPSASASASATATASASASSSASAAPTASAGGSADSEGKELSAAALFKTWAPSVVTVATQTAGGVITGGGTGFLLDKRGTIVTNSHVIAGADKAEIRFMDGARYTKITVLADDGIADIALLSVKMNEPEEGEPSSAEPVELGDSEAIVVGERAISIGNPLGLEHTLTTGVVSARRKFQGRPWIQMSTPISPGNSGGPVFNGRGEVMGVTTASLSGGRAQNLNLAVPINVLKALIKPDYPDSHPLGKKGGSQW